MHIEHIAVYVADLEKSRNFFEKYFNAKTGDLYHNQKTGFKSYFLSFDQGSRLELMQRPELTKTDKPLIRTGFIHIALALGSKDKVDELTAKLKNDGYCIISGPRTTGDGYYESCFLDLEGNQIELTV